MSETHPSPSGNTYFIQETQTELIRLYEQDRLLTQLLGGVLPEHPDPAAFLAPMQTILDVACGTGGWAMSLAHIAPHLEIIGFDIDEQMIRYANALAQVGRFSTTSFEVMDASGPLDYPDHAFDLVNARYFSVVPRTTWMAALQEILRITKPGGWIRLTEAENNSLTTSPAFEQLSGLLLQSLKRQGIGFSTDGRSTGTTIVLAHTLRKVGCQQVQIHPFVLDWSVGTPAHQAISQERGIFLHLITPYLVAKQMITKEEAERLVQQAREEMLEENFCAHWYYLTAWGQKPLTP